MGSKLSYFEVTSPDMDRAQSFYREMFDWQVQSLPEIPGFGTIAVFADPDGNQVGLWDRDGFGAV